MNLIVTIGLKCKECGKEPSKNEMECFIDENTYDKRWGWSIFESWFEYVKRYEDKGWFCDEEYDDTLCPVCSKKVKEELRKEQFREAKLRRQQDKKNQALAIKQQLMKDPSIAKMLMDDPNIAKILPRLADIINKDNAEGNNIEDIKEDEIDDPYDVENDPEYQKKRAVEVAYVNKWMKSLNKENKKKNKVITSDVKKGE